MRWTLFALLLLATACHRAPQPVAFDGALTDDRTALIRHGERLTHVLGCTGCHGAHLQGEQFEPQMKQYGPIYASNLTVEIPEYTDEQLDGIIRHGTHPKRHTVWVMPSEVFQHLHDADYRALVMYLRSLKPSGSKLPSPQFSAQDRRDIASGLFKPAAQLVRDRAAQLPLDLGPKFALGRYITEVTCAECHGPRLGGHSDPTGKTPDLIVVGGYSRADFERLITQGIPTPARKLNPMMSGVALTRFSHLTPSERNALYAYLEARAERP